MKKNAKSFISKPNQKVQNINIKPLLKPYNSHNKPCFEKVKMKNKKQPKILPFPWATSSLKNQIQLPKVAQ